MTQGTAIRTVHFRHVGKNTGTQISAVSAYVTDQMPGCPDLLDHMPIRFVALLTAPPTGCGVCRLANSRRFAVLSVMDDHRPDCPRDLVGECDGDQHTRLSGEHARQP